MLKYTDSIYSGKLKFSTVLSRTHIYFKPHFDDSHNTSPQPAMKARQFERFDKDDVPDESGVGVIRIPSCRKIKHEPEKVHTPSV